jgi:hypothetical protein
MQYFGTALDQHSIGADPDQDSDPEGVKITKIKFFLMQPKTDISR